MPSLRDYSFYELSSVDMLKLDDFKLDIEFKFNKLNGIILFAAENSDGSGDYISLILRNGLIELV